MRLNLGSGMCQISGWTSVDIDPEMHPDVVADVEALPFEDNSVEEIFASHILEHVPYDSPALSEWYRVLKIGGACTVIVPDIVQVYYMWRHGMGWGPYNLRIDEEYINATAFGAHIIKNVPEMHFGEVGHTHKQIFLFDMLIQRMLAAGFERVSDVVQCSLRAVTFGETMVTGYKYDGKGGCYTDKPYCLRRGEPPREE